MRKLKILFASLVLALGGYVSAQAEIGISVGATATAGAFFASGSETETDATPDDSGVEDGNDAIVYGMTSVFVDYTIEQAGGIRIGIDYVPETLSTATQGRTDTADPNADSDTNNSGTSEVSVDFSDLITAYIEVPIFGSGAYLKAGYKDVDVKTKEVLHTGSTYGDTSMQGYMIGFGGKANLPGDVAFVKFEGSYTDFDDISLTSETNTHNKVQAEVEGVALSVSLGKTF
tara:strand:+ start:260 stop:952 length:693 start_codon:yes stop_codon:yes gene_type:complete